MSPTLLVEKVLSLDEELSLLERIVAGTNRDAYEACPPLSHSAPHLAVSHAESPLRQHTH